MVMNERRDPEVRETADTRLVSRAPARQRSRRPYTPPHIERVGGLEHAVLSPTPGQFESGPGISFRSS